MRQYEPAVSCARRTSLRIVACALLLYGSTLAAPRAHSQAVPRIDISSAALREPSPDLQEALARRGDLVLRGSSLEAALFTINELWKVNIIAGQIDGQVNGVFKDAPLKEILDTILLGNGYGYRLVGESVVVSRLEQLGQINPFFVSAAIQISNARASELVDAAALLSTPQGQVRAVDSARSLIVIDFPERVQMIRDLVESIDAASGGPGMLDSTGRPKPLEVGYFHTQYVTVADAKKVLATVLGPVGRAEAVEGEDRLIVVDFAENLQMAERVLQQIDQPRPQVQITALIYDLSLEDVEQLGINWNHAVKFKNDAAGDPLAAIQADSVLQTPFNPNGVGATFTFLNLSSNFDLSAVVLALQNAGDSRLLANPNVTVMDNERANFEAVTQIPYQQITQTGNGGQLAGTAFKDAGIKLDVVPKIAIDGTIELNVRPEFSRLTGFTPGDNQPIIDTRATSTLVRVGNGQTLVIGGMRQRSDVGDFAGVPGLKDVRWWGHLFRSRSTNIRESELVVFITPRIVGYSDPLNCRDQLVKDTIDCRLDRVPRAEGCPLGCECPAGNCPAGSDAWQPSLASEDHPPSMDGTPAPAEPLPPGHPLFEARLHPSESPTSHPLVRRLPPPPGEHTANRPVVEMPDDGNWRLRRDYDARFRATGGVYANQQRQLERTPEPQVPQTAEQKSWWQKVLLR
jgi:general secretion pathway protein D